MSSSDAGNARVAGPRSFAPSTELRAAMNSFTNPIVEATPPAGAADPSVAYRDGYYYYCKSLDDGAIGVAKAERLQDIGKVPMRRV